MFQPLAWAPLTVHGVGVVTNGGVPQTATRLPLIEPPAAALLSKTLPSDHTSPVTSDVELPWKVNELVPPPPHVGASVWIAAPFAPVTRASAVAVAPTVTVDANPSTCIIVMPI